MENPAGEAQFATVAEVADLMRVSKMSVYRLIHSGELEAVRFGRTFRIPREAIDKYLAQAQYTAPEMGVVSAE